MKVGLVTTSFPLGSNAASGTFVARLAETLAKRVELEVLTPAGTERDPPASEAFRVRYFRYAPRQLQKLAHQPGGVPVALRTSPVSVLFLPAFVAVLFIEALRLARRCDVIHANWSACGAVAGIAGWLTRRPVITTLRGSDVIRLDRSMAARLLLMATLRTNARVICVSSDIERQVSNLFPKLANRVAMVPNGVDERLLSVKPQGHAPGELRVVAVGSLIPRKAFDTLISAFALLNDSRISLSLIGDGPERTRLTAMIEELGLQGRVRAVGTVPPADIPRFLACGDVLVLSSRHEGRPNVVIEAMAAGLPIVATALPGVRELVLDGHNGLLFDPGDAAGLAGHLTRLQEDPELRAAMGTASRRRISELGLSWERAADSYCELYCAAARGH